MTVRMTSPSVRNRAASGEESAWARDERVIVSQECLSASPVSSFTFDSAWRYAFRSGNADPHGPSAPSPLGEAFGDISVPRLPHLREQSVLWRIEADVHAVLEVPPV